jgi:hypothetical protein
VAWAEVFGPKKNEVRRPASTTPPAVTRISAKFSPHPRDSFLFDDLAVVKRFLVALRSARGAAISGSLGGLAIPPPGNE